MITVEQLMKAYQAWFRQPCVMHREEKGQFPMVSQSQELVSVDLYYVCQVIDGVTREPFAFIRNIEEIFGDMASTSLARVFPKWTCLHVFIEEVVSSLIFEDLRNADKRISAYWIAHLIESNMPKKSIYKGMPVFSTAHEYFEWLSDQGLINDLCEAIAKQAFHVIFSNRGVLRNFSLMVSNYVSETAPCFAPESFTNRGHLFRKSAPIWAKHAVYHRDKGRCVICKCDLTKTISQFSETHYDHIVPLSLGGINCVANLQLTCSKCNLDKSNHSSLTSLSYENWNDY